jgi:histidine triad (HIT) family protein
MEDCIFCRIVAGDIPAHRVFEDDTVLAIADIGHVNPGHTLVIAKTHAPTLMDLDADTAAAAFRAANRVAKAIERAFAPDGLTVLQANRSAGFQTVPHFHIHLLPRQEGDGVGRTWPAQNPPAGALAANAAKIRAALAVD